MRLMRLLIENYKGIRVCDITPEPKGPTQVKGPNGAGKSSVLDGFANVIGGDRLSPQQPIRHGADKATIVAEFDTMTVKKVFTEKRTYLTAHDRKTGKPIASVQTFLNELVGPGGIGFDLGEFLGMKDAEQVAMLKELVGLDYSDLDAKEAQLVEDRKIAKRDRANVAANWEACEHFPDVTGPVDVEHLLAERQKLEVQQQDNERKRFELRQAEQTEQMHDSSVAAAQRRVDELKKELAEAEATVQEITDQRSKARDKVVSLQYAKNLTDPDFTEIDEQLANASAVNSKHESNQRRAATENALTQQDAVVEQVEHDIQKVRDEKKQRIAAVDMPIDGLSFDENGVTYQGIPFAQVNEADQMAVVVSIVLAMRKEIRLILMRHGSLLDKQAMDRLGHLLDANDAQALVEVVSDDLDGDGIVIHDGQVRSEADAGDAPEAEDDIDSF